MNSRLISILALSMAVAPLRSYSSPPLPPGYTSLGEAAVELRASGRHLTRFKQLGPAGELVEGFTDENGHAVNGHALLALELAAIRSERGVATKALFAAASKRAADAPTRVLVWSAPPEIVLRKELWRTAPDQAEQLRLQQEAAIVTARSGLVALLAARGIAAQPLVGLPVVRATIPAGDAIALAKLPGVARVGLDEDDLVPTSTTFRDTVGAGNAHVWGFDGAGQVVGLSLNQGPSSTACLTDAVVQGAASTTSPDATAATGTIRSATGGDCGLNAGVAPGASLKVSDSADVPGCDDVCWALAQGATILGIGWAPPSSEMVDAEITERDAALDLRVKYWPYPLIVASAGNSNAPDGTPCSASPTAGYVQNHLYSGIVVGGSDENGTAGTADDTMYPCSSWKNPSTLYGDRELPELVAPSVNIETAGAGPATGTSFAAAIVAGAAALAVQRNPELAGWPEAQRAILMARARV